MNRKPNILAAFLALALALTAGEYGATLRYDCFSIPGNTPLNGAEIKLTLSVH